jgi:hypothetical protein
MKNFLRSFLFTLLIIPSESYSQSLKINEFEAKNSSTISDNYNEFDDWIEISNPGSAAINLNGYYLTDKLADQSKCKLTATGSELTLPAGGFIILWADKDVTQGSRHLNFKLSGDGGQIGIYSPSLQLIDTLSYSLQYNNISMGRDLSNSTLWKYYSTPTPGTANSTQAFAGVAASPTFNYLTAIYSTALQIILNLSQAGDNIRYTANNADPDAFSPIYSTPIQVAETHVIRAMGQKIGYINSPIISQIYFENVNHSLAILAIITDSLNLYGPTGIYDHPTETDSSWERFCQLKFLVDGQVRTESNAGIRIQGSSSVTMDKKSFRLFFRDEYGNGSFDYPFFGNNNLETFKRLVLKAGYDDDITTTTGTLLRDALSANLWGRLGELSNLSAWSALYLNNRYWGIYNIRESVDEHYIMAHTTLTDFDLVRFRNEGGTLKYGTLTAWNELYNYIIDGNLANTLKFQHVESLMDMDDFISLMAFVQCTQYYSWCWGISMYRGNTTGAKWKSTIWDTDRAYTDVNWNGFNDWQNTSDYHWGNIFPKQLLLNTEFDRRLINRICDLLNSTMKPENSLPVFDSLYQIIKPEMPKELARWNPSHNYWETNVEAVRAFLRNRPDILKNQIKNYFSLSGTHTITLDVNGSGTIKVNALHITQFPWSGDYFENNTFDIIAVPSPGNKFIGWNQVETNPVKVKTVNLTENTSFTAYFEPGIDAVNSVSDNNVMLNAFPNPFSNQTCIKFSTHASVPFEINIYNISGQFVKNLCKGNAMNTSESVYWNGERADGSMAPNGIYFVSIKTPDAAEILKLTLIR